ncbi:Cofac_haem_bdg domain-containing protein [Durusdinium trenchii]|uniref:Cofac_haem_bdg domain-containing protein n=1 Tax=Durusdinium trenchii TaxID=1381693 RepID=A0ABP0QL55_9DINO
MESKRGKSTEVRQEVRRKGRSGRKQMMSSVGLRRGTELDESEVHSFRGEESKIEELVSWRATTTRQPRGNPVSTKLSEVLRGDLQAKLELVDGRSGRRVALPKLLKPGGALHDADLLCIGEIHDSPGDHAVQRLLLDALTYALFLELRSSEGVAAAAPRGRTPQNLSPQRVAVGVEYFSRQQQPTLDTLIFDKSKDALGSSPSKFREACDWDRVWSYDWELYAPLFRFCQLNLNRIVGLNLPLEAVLVVSRGGLEAAPEWLREQLPPLDLTQEKHRRRFEDMLRMPLEDAVGRMSLPLSNWSPKQELNKMYQAQVLWDEYMANTAAKYLTDVGGRLVVLAGTNHVWRDAIPERFERMTASRASAGDPPRKAVSVVPWRGEQLPPLGACDFLVPMEGPGGGEELAQDLLRQRERLRGQSRVFPAPPEARGKLESFDCKESSGDHWIGLDGRLPAKFTAESLIQVLDEITPGRYNFVYVPHDKRKLRNLALAFVNFSEPSAAQQAYDFFKNVKHPVMGPSVRVCQADIQGLGSNLAYFMARFGLQEMGNPHAPMVFENGVRQTNMVEAVKRHVTVDLLVQVRRRIRGRGRSAGGWFRWRTGGGSDSFKVHRY